MAVRNITRGPHMAMHIQNTLPQAQPAGADYLDMLTASLVVFAGATTE